MKELVGSKIYQDLNLIGIIRCAYVVYMYVQMQVPMNIVHMYTKMSFGVNISYSGPPTPGHLAGGDVMTASEYKYFTASPHFCNSASVHAKYASCFLLYLPVSSIIFIINSS